MNTAASPLDVKLADPVGERRPVAVQIAERQNVKRAFRLPDAKL